MQISAKTRLVCLIVALVFMAGALIGTGTYLIINHINNGKALNGSYDSIGNIFSGSSLNPSVCSTLINRIGNNTGQVRNLDSGTPIVFEMAGEYWQVVYRDTNENTDIITVWMTEPYISANFDENDPDNPYKRVFYSDSQIRNLILDYYNKQSISYPILDSVVVSPNQVSDAYKIGQDTDGTIGGFSVFGSTLSIYDDKFWLPSCFEVHNLWGLDNNDRGFNSSDVSNYYWLRSLSNSGFGIYLQVDHYGGWGNSFLYESLGVRPAAHISLSALAAAAIQYNITVQSNNDSWGTVSGGGAFGPNTATILTATPATGYNFVGWQLNGEIVSTSASYPITVTADATYTAVFEPKTYTITANSNDTSQGTVSGGGSYQHNAEVTITATPMEHYNFAYFQVGNEQITQNPYKFNATGNVTVIAYFTPKSYTVTITTTNGGQILKDNTLHTKTQITQNYNTQITSLYAIASASYAFLYWLDSATGQRYTNNPLNYTVSTDTTLTAVFGSSVAGGVAVVAENGGEARVSGYDENDATTLHVSAVAYTGYQFLGWYIMGEESPISTELSTDLALSQVQNKIIIARFTPIENLDDMNTETDNGYNDDFV